MIFDFLLLTALLLFPVSSMQYCEAQGDARAPVATPSADVLTGVPDVAIFVMPTSNDLATVSVAYRNQVRHAQVMQEIDKLSANGWMVGKKIAVSDDSIGRSVGVTTSAHFELRRAPQVLNSAPRLLPYLQAFQDRSHVTVMFLLPDLKPYNGVESFDTPALIVRRIPEEGSYRYEALIQDHKGKLPELTVAPPPVTPPALGAMQRSAPSRTPLLPIMLILCAVGIAGGLAVYNLAAKRTNRSIPRRTAR